MIINTNDYKLLKGLEGFRSKTYKCSADNWTIGYGSTAYPFGKVKPHDRRISKEEAHVLLELHIKKEVLPVMKGLVLNKNQHEAIVSLVYNIGEGAFNTSTVRRKIAKKDYSGASKAILAWNKVTVKGKKIVSRGLMKRRKFEKKLFDTPTKISKEVKKESLLTMILKIINKG